MARKWKTMSESEWKKIKVLLDANLTSKLVQEITNRSNATVKNVKESKSYQDYKRITTEIRSRYPSKFAPTSTPVPEAAANPASDNKFQDSIDKLVALLQIQAETSEAINDRLRTIEGQVGFIHDHIPAASKGWFGKGRNA